MLWHCMTVTSIYIISMMMVTEDEEEDVNVDCRGFAIDNNNNNI